MRSLSVLIPAGLLLAVILLVSQPLHGTEDNSQTNLVEHGRYLVKIAGCGDCHSPKVMSEHGIEEDTTRLLSGHPADEPITAMPAAPGDGWMVTGNGHFTAWAGPWGISFAANLTSDEKTGIGNWTDDQFIKAMHTGKHRGYGRPILPPMPWPNLSHATDDDLKAMLAYLKSTKPISNQVPAPIPPPGSAGGN